MSKKFIFIFLIFSLIFSSKSQDIHTLFEEEDGIEDYDNDQFFKESLKEYLVENNLFESERVIKPDEMKKIFLEVLLNGEPDTPGELGRIIRHLAEYFVNTYYKDRKEIRAKEIYNLFDINEISDKFEQMAGNGNLNEDDDSQNDYDRRDAVGDPNPDV